MNEPQFNESSVQSHAHLETDLTPEMLAEIERARAAHLAGKPGELHFQVEIKRADGSVEKHTLIGTVDGAS